MIIAHTYNGLANRMRAAVSSFILAEQLNRPMRLIWPLGHGMHCPFEDLFEPSGIEFFSLPSNSLHPERARTPHAHLPAGTRIWQDGLSNFNGGRYDHVRHLPLVVSRRRLQDLPETLYIRTCFAFRPEWLDSGAYDAAFREVLQHRFQPRVDILEQVMELPANTVGVHVRQGDKVSDPVLKPLQCGSLIERFFPAMDALVESEPDVRFFLCSDDDKVKSAMREKYESRILTYPDVAHARDTVAGMRDALRDLYTLASSKLILTDGNSSFGPLAARYFGRPVKNMRPDYRGPGRIQTMRVSLAGAMVQEARRLWRGLNRS